MDRGDVDDRSAAVAGHVRNGVLGAEVDGADHVVDRPCSNRRCQVDHRAPLIPVGVVHQDVELAVAVDREVDHVLNRSGFLLDVGENERGLTAGRADLGDRLFALGVVDVCDDDLRAFLRHQLRRALTDALGRAGDDRDLILQPHARSSSTAGRPNPSALKEMIASGVGERQCGRRSLLAVQNFSLTPDAVTNVLTQEPRSVEVNWATENLRQLVLHPEKCQPCGKIRAPAARPGGSTISWRYQGRQGPTWQRSDRLERTFGPSRDRPFVTWGSPSVPA